MKDFVNRVLTELKSDLTLNKNSLVKLVIESTNKSIVNQDNYDNIYVQLKDSLKGVNEHLKNKKISVLLSQFNKQEKTTYSILHEMSKVANLSSKLELIKESNAYSNPIIKSKVDSYCDSINSGYPEFRLYPSFINEMTQHIHEKSVKTVVDQVINIVKNKATDFELLNTIHIMTSANSQTPIYESIAESLKKSLAENKYSADIINLMHGESNLPLVTQLVNNLRIIEASKDGSFTLGAGNIDTKIQNVIAPSIKIKNGIITYVDNRFMKISESTKLTGNETEVHINEQIATATAIWTSLSPSNKKAIKQAVKEVEDTGTKVTKSLVKTQLKKINTGVAAAKDVVSYIEKSVANPLNWWKNDTSSNTNEGFTIATMNPEFVKAKFPKFYKLSEAFASLGFVPSSNREGVESNSIRNFKMGLNTNEARGLDIYLNDNKIDGLKSINLTEALLMETPEVKSRVEFVFENVSSIFAFEFIKNISNDRLLSEATVFELGGNYILCNKPNTADRIWNKVDELQMSEFFNENFQYDISSIFATKIDETIELKRRIETAKAGILENINKLEGSVAKLNTTIKSDDVDASKVAELEKLKTSINESISKLKEDYINVDLSKSKVSTAKVDEGEMPAGLKAYHDKKKAKKDAKTSKKSKKDSKSDDETSEDSDENGKIDESKLEALMTKYGRVNS